MLRHEYATLWQGDREIFPADVAYIRTFAQQFPGLTRTELTYTLCEHLDWLTPAGRPKFTACAKLLARLEQAGERAQPAFAAEAQEPSWSSVLRTEASERSDRSTGVPKALSVGVGAGAPAMGKRSEGGRSLE